MKICFATNEMIPQIKEIWKRCFGDEEDYIGFYFAHRFTEENMLVCMEEDKPVAMTTFLKAYLMEGQEEVPVHYAYAVATLPEYQGRGYARALLEEGKQHFGTAVVLEPAGESLIYYYEKLGFRKAFPVAERIISPDEIAKAEGEVPGQQEYWLLTVTPAEYAGIRDAYFKGKGYIRWDKDAIAYALLENDYADGYAYKIQHHGKEDILFFREMEGETAESGVKNNCLEITGIEVLETSLSEKDLLAVLKRLRIKVPVKVRRSIKAAGQAIEWAAQKGENIAYQKKYLGMINGCETVTEGYLNLTLE